MRILMWLERRDKNGKTGLRTDTSQSHNLPPSDIRFFGLLKEAYATKGSDVTKWGGGAYLVYTAT